MCTNFHWTFKQLWINFESLEKHLENEENINQQKNQFYVFKKLRNFIWNFGLKPEWHRKWLKLEKEIETTTTTKKTRKKCQITKEKEQNKIRNKNDDKKPPLDVYD